MRREKRLREILMPTKLEGIKEITVPAGRFRCFKIVEYDDAGNALRTWWESDKVKSDVKVWREHYDSYFLQRISSVILRSRSAASFLKY
jgi:hypothetical protein